MRRTLISAALLLCLLATCLYAQEANIPWDKIKGHDALSGRQKKVVAEVISKEFCYYGCTDTILNCLVNEPDSKAAKRIAAFVVRRAILGLDAKGIKSNLKNRALSAFPPVEHKSKFDGLKAYGDPKALVKVVVYADFECPYCRIASPSLRRIVKKMPDKVAMYFKNFPIRSHKHGIQCSTVLVAADRQGKFWEMHDLLYANAPDFEEEQLVKYMKQIGMDVEKAQKDRKDPSLIDRIRKEKEEGLAFGMEGTPGIFINNKFYRGVKMERELLDRVEEELEIIESGE